MLYEVITTIPLETLDDCFIIAAHAEVHRFEDGEIVQSETGWGAGDNISDGSWAMLFKYCVQECDDCTFETIYYDFIGGQTIPTGVRITSYNVCYTKLLRVQQKIFVAQFLKLFFSVLFSLDNHLSVQNFSFHFFQILRF